MMSVFLDYRVEYYWSFRGITIYHMFNLPICSTIESNNPKDEHHKCMKDLKVLEFDVNFENTDLTCRQNRRKPAKTRRNWGEICLTVRHRLFDSRQDYKTVY